MSSVTAKVYDINDFRQSQEPQDTCIDDVLEEWEEVLHRKLVEIYDELGPSAAYQFHHRLCGTELPLSRTIVDIVVGHS